MKITLIFLHQNGRTIENRRMKLY